MPRMTYTCSTPLCGRKATARGRCDLHQPKARAIRSALGGEHHRLYNNKRWRMMSKAQLAAHPLCAMCGRAAEHADHIEPHRGDPHEFWTGALQSLCASCHGRKTQKDLRTG